MKTTLDIPDALLRRVKSYAALKGKTMRELFVEAVQEKLDAAVKGTATIRGWRTVFGKAQKGTTREVQAAIDAEFESVNMEDWK